MRRAAVLLATGFGLGYLPFAPATWTSLATCAILFPFVGRMGAMPILVAVALLTPIAIAASGEAERTLGHDARPIVIDEIVGMLVSVLAVPIPPGGLRAALLLALAFLLFRFFDVAKPTPVRQAQRLPGGYGVVVDDLLAGLYTNAALQIVTRLVFPPGGGA